MAKQRWVFVVRALDKPGTLTAAAAVFSNRGVSLEGILGSGIDPTTDTDGRLIFNFQATEAKQALLKKALERLSSVFDVDAFTYDDERLRAIAVAKISAQAKVAKDDEGYALETIAQTPGERIIMLTGKAPAVEAAVAQFRDQQHLKDVVMSYIAI
ncbi:hypothetical protein C7271_25940 [filamentous cyanobacterium CCP5]|nr:hypothetical protein C7271_25940 [filamentous cyanobacterium CCP5]